MNCTLTPHPIEATLAERFDFLDEDQRRTLVSVLRSPDSIFFAEMPFSIRRFVADKLVVLVRDLAIHIDLECEWQRIQNSTPEQIREKLAEAGIDCDKSFARLQRTLARHGLNIRTAEEWKAEHERQYRQLMGLPDLPHPDCDDSCLYHCTEAGRHPPTCANKTSKLNP